MGNLNKVTYTDHQTVITADNLNAIQDSVIQNTSYTTCTTGASTAAKTAALTNFVLTTGSAVKVKFTNTNTAANPTLNVNSTGAKPIMQYGVTAVGTTPSESWNDGAVVEFVYDGTNWVMQGRNTIDAVSKSAGGTFDGDVVIDDKGTTTSSEVSILTLGNSTATGTVGNSNGMIRMYGQGDKYVQIRPITTSGTYTTDNRTIMLPDLDGTVMLNVGGVFTGNIRVAKENNDTSNTQSLITVGNNIPEGTAGASYGGLQLYGSNDKYIFIRTPAAALAGNRTLTLPDLTGTIMTDKGGVFTGGITINRSDGTTSAAGNSSIYVGNNIPEGTTGNSYGRVQIFGKGAYYGVLLAENVTANRAVNLPDASGTIALEGETGSNTNGYYTKYSDGTLIQWNTVNVNLTLSQIGSSGIYSTTTTITFPIAFPNTTYVAYGSSRYQTGHVVPIGTVQSGAGYMTVGVYDFYPRSGSIKMSWCAIGRWK